VLAVGDSIPDVRVWMGPQERVSLRELADEKPLLLVFYLFDWAKSH
jgi:peroxiredoxin